MSFNCRFTQQPLPRAAGRNKVCMSTPEKPSTRRRGPQDPSRPAALVVSLNLGDFLFKTENKAYLLGRPSFPVSRLMSQIKEQLAKVFGQR